MATIKSYHELKDLSVEELMKELKIKDPTPEEIQEDILKRQLKKKIAVKKYYEKNREKLIEKKHEDKKNNPEEFIRKQKEWNDRYLEKINYKYTCSCGKSIKRISKRTHDISAYHIKNVNKVNEDLVVESIPI